MKTKITLWLIAIFMGMGTCGLNAQTSLPRSTVYAEGVDPQGVLDLIDSVERCNVELHSLMIIRHGKVVTEGWWKPYKPEFKHIMHSVSKAFTSMAMGMAITEGRLSLDDKVVSFFPDDLPDTVSPNLAAMTVRNLLTMTTGQDPARSFPSDSRSWAKAFLATPMMDKPGSSFRYDSYSTYMVSAIFQKVMGQRVFDFLKPRLFDPLGITDIDSETDPMGIDVGGWGMRIRTEDMAKFGQLLLQKGHWNGKQLIPEAWLAEASAPQVWQEPDVEPEKRNDWSLGYGYQIWRSMYNTYRADGAYGQFIVVMPDKDAVVIMTAGLNDLTLIWKFLYPAISDTPIPEDKALAEKLNCKMASLELPAPKGESNSSLAAEISGKKYEVTDSLGHKYIVSFDFDGTVCKVGIDDRRDIAFGAESWLAGKTDVKGPYYFPSRRNLVGVTEFEAAGSYRFTAPNALELTLKYTECTSLYNVKCTFDGDNIDVAVLTNMGPKTITMKGVRK